MNIKSLDQFSCKTSQGFTSSETLTGLVNVILEFEIYELVAEASA